MSDALQKIENLLTEYATPTRHSFFQLRAFNVNTEPTIQGRLRRCLIELQARRNSLVEMTLGIEDIQDQITLIELEKQQLAERSPEDEFAKKMQEIEIRRRDRRIESQRMKLAETRRIYFETLEESLFFVDTFQALEKLEPLKKFDDPQVQNEYWDAKYKEEVLYRKLAGLPPDPQMIKEILALPEECEIRAKLTARLDAIEDHQEPRTIAEN